MAEKQDVKKKGTTKTEQIIGSGLAKVEKVTKDLQKATADLGTLASSLEDYSIKIADAEGKLASLTTQFNEEKRQKQVDIDVEIQQYAYSKALSLVQAKGEVAVSRDEYSAILAKAQRNEDEIKKDKDTAVAIATNSLKSKYESDLKLQIAEFNTKEAENKAKIVNLEDKNKTLIEQSNDWKKQLDDERKAGVDRAKASAIGAVNVTGQGR